MLDGGQEAGRRIALAALPARDHLARARVEDAVGAAGVEPQCRKRSLYALALRRQQPQVRLDTLGLLATLLLEALLLGELGLDFPSCVFLDLAPQRRILLDLLADRRLGAEFRQLLTLLLDLLIGSLMVGVGRDDRRRGLAGEVVVATAREQHEDRRNAEP